MLHVFHVDSGRMMTFDMSLALESVDNLKRYVQEEFKIAADKQVLLISGGECLDPNKRVCSFSAGTDTNPIFLFSKSIIESPTPPLPIADHGSENDIDLKVKEHCDMPVTFGTVAKRAQLAQQMLEISRKQLTVCENLVHDQHLQQQGWSAVVANLEDISYEFRKRSEIFEKSFTDYIEEREAFMTFLSHFNSDLEILQKIPVLPALLENKNSTPEESKAFEDNEMNTSDTSQTSVTGRDFTLYEWISAADNKSTMDQLYDHCSRGLEQFDHEIFRTLSNDIQEMLQNADNAQMKEVKGLGERLFGLETLMREAKKYVKQQAELAQSFANNQNRASNTKDPSVLPDLCLSHKQQLQMMARNHQQLCDIRRRCAKAKEELSVNLYHRLKWVMYVEDHILEIDQKLVIYHENLKRLRRHLEILQQIHLAPATYLCAVAEVVRRRTFSQTFLLWASELACHLLTIHNEEVTRRKEFQIQFEGHFLNSLFPGMDDMPPSFATQAPAMFDVALPKITQEDIDRLKKELPDFAENLNVPDASTLINFFLMRSLTRKDYEEEEERGCVEIKAVEEKLIQAVNEVGLTSDLDRDLLRGTGSEPCLATSHGLAHLKDLDRGCESETDTEEFEKVSQSPLELNFDKNIPTLQPRTQDASTFTEDNLQITKRDYDKLKSCLSKLNQLANEAIIQLRSEVTELKSQVVSSLNDANQHCDTLSTTWNSLMIIKENKEKENLDEMKVIIDNLKKQEEMKDRHIKDLLLEKSTLECEILKTCENLNELKDQFNNIIEENSKTVEDLQKQLQEKELEKEKSIKEVSDRLKRNHKAELESIRTRFKLMTMERSPSDNNLDKSADFASLPNHSTLLLQMTENFEMDKEKAINEALLKERSHWEKLLSIRIRELENKFEEDKEFTIQNLAKKITEEKDKQIDILMDRERNLNLECMKYKNTIQQLAENETECSDSELLKKIDALQKDKDSLEQELEKIKNDRAIDLATSLAVCDGKVDATGNPLKQKEGTKAESGRCKISIDSCKPGDIVLILWDEQHESFKVIQENKHLFFLHSDYLQGLGLEITEGKPNRMYCAGEVVDKEYCYARKSENRYKVPKRTKFFRVKVKSTNPPLLMRDVTQSLYQPKNSMETSRMTQSQSGISTTNKDVASEEPISLPPSPTKLHPVILEKNEEIGLTNKDDEEEEEKDTDLDKHFAEDSGIVDVAEQAIATLDDTLTTISHNRNESESSSDR